MSSRWCWSSRGYRAFCRWTASDDDFFVLRRFGKSSARVALYLQDQVAHLEEELEKVDLLCSQAPKEFADGGTFRHDRWPRRRAILDELTVSLERYRKYSIWVCHLAWYCWRNYRAFYPGPLSNEGSPQCYSTADEEHQVMVGERT